MAANFPNTVLHSCYAYAISEVMGVVHKLQGDSNVDPILSFQEILDNYPRILLANLGSPEPAIAQAMSFLQTYGISPEVHYRRSTTQQRMNYRITSFEKIEVENEEAAMANVRACPLVGMVLSNDEFKNLQSGEVYRGPANGVVEHEHAVVVTGFAYLLDGTLCYEIKNSWGTQWGSDGFAMVSASGFSCFWRINGVHRYVAN